MDKFTRRETLLAEMLNDRVMRAYRKRPYFDGEALQICIIFSAIMAMVFIAAWIAMDSIYNLLDKAGVFSAIFNFMGW